MLDGYDPQCVRQDEPLAGAMAERLVCPISGVRVTLAYRSQECLRSPAVVLDAARAQLVMQFLVYDDLLVAPGVRSSRAGGAGTAHSLLRRRGGTLPSPRTGCALARAETVARCGPMRKQ